MTHTYTVHVTRDDRWWMITVPELDGYVTKTGAINIGDTTQARRVSEIETQARDLICTVTDSAPSEVAMDITITINGFDITKQAKRVREDREEAERLAALAASSAKGLAQDLAAYRVPVRDVGEVLGVSFQRAQQLINS